LVFFVVLALLPGRAARRPAEPSPAARLVPDSRLGSAAAGLVLTGVLALAFFVFGVDALGRYGWGLFVGAPFCLGLLAALVYSAREPRGSRECVGVACASVLLSSLALLLAAQDGAVCISLALPLTLPLGALGGAVAYALRGSRGGGQLLPGALCSAALLLPLAGGLEAAGPQGAPIVA